MRRRTAIVKKMKLFKYSQVRAAVECAVNGGQALHLWIGDNFHRNDKKTPACFKRSKEWGHLLDQDIERLKKTAHKLGVRVIKVSAAGKRNQHIDLCGKPLERAKKLAVEPAYTIVMWGRTLPKTKTVARPKMETVRILRYTDPNYLDCEQFIFSTKLLGPGKRYLKEEFGSGIKIISDVSIKVPCGSHPLGLFMRVYL